LPHTTLAHRYSEGVKLCCKLYLVAPLLVLCILLPAHSTAQDSTNPPSQAANSPSKTHPKPAASRANTRKNRRKTAVPHPAKTRQSIHLSQAFSASSELRPMAQQLALTRSPAAYSGVTAYARSHSGEAAAAAYLALGHAYLLDHSYTQAATAFESSRLHGSVLADYADFLEAQTEIADSRPADALSRLNGFSAHHPGSIFISSAAILQANTLIARNDAKGALAVLLPLSRSPIASHADFQLALARAQQESGNTAEATRLYRALYINLPLSSESAQAATQLDRMNAAPSAAERKSHADQLFNAGRYSDAESEYAALSASEHALAPADRDALEVYRAVCRLKLHHISRRDAEMLPRNNDDSGAARLYILTELARAENETATHREVLDQLRTQFPQSRWTEEALFSAGNMYQVRLDTTQAAIFYLQLVQSFPHSTYAPSAHWRAAWMQYRLRSYPQAAKLMDEQLQSYPGGQEIPGALYWRGRLYEQAEHNPSQAANYYRTLVNDYPNAYYALLARDRLSELGTVPPAAPSPFLAYVHAPDIPKLSTELPENDPHLIRARLVANAALNEYIAPEIQASAGGAAWGSLAEAEIYASYGENFRALETLKHSNLSFFSYQRQEVPWPYWQILFPRPWWDDIAAQSQRNGLDPNLVAALIRQESEFNPGAVSRANAYGLMQLLPSVGKSTARKQGMHNYAPTQLLDPHINITLGTANLASELNHFGGQLEYALAAYNAGDSNVKSWQADDNYQEMAEFTESIPFGETRNYVQAILRNREMYRTLYSDK